MAYFEEFPTIQYDIGKTGSEIELTNILRGVRIRDSLKNNAVLYIRYDYKDADRPEHIANRLYDDPETHWIVMMANEVVDPFYDLPLSEFTLNKFIEDKYPGQTFFLNMSFAATSSSSSSSEATSYVTITGAYLTDEYVRTDTTLLTGTAVGGSLNHIKLPSGASTSDDYYNGAVIVFDGGTGAGQTAIISDYNATSRRATFSAALSSHIGCDTTFSIYVSGKVHRWDATYSRLEVSDIVGTFSKYDTIIGVTSATEAVLERKIAQSKSAVHHFEDSTGKWLNPRDASINYIGGYIIGTDNSTIETAVITNEVYEREQNDAKRFVNLLDPDLVPIVTSNFEELISEGSFE